MAISPQRPRLRADLRIANRCANDCRRSRRLSRWVRRLARLVSLIISRTDWSGDTVIGRIDRRLADRIAKWRCWSRKRIINALDAMCARSIPTRYSSVYAGWTSAASACAPQSAALPKWRGFIVAEAGMATPTSGCPIWPTACAVPTRGPVISGRGDGHGGYGDRIRACLPVSGARRLPPTRRRRTCAPCRCVVNIIAGSEAVPLVGVRRARLHRGPWRDRRRAGPFTCRERQSRAHSKNRPSATLKRCVTSPPPRSSGGCGCAI